MNITLDTLDYVKKSELFEDIDASDYTQITELFVDSSGLGSPNESALTYEELLMILSELCNEHGELHTFITDVGQFQVHLGIYTEK
jgi:hypothetical protein